jgi:hypothetical protein
LLKATTLQPTEEQHVDEDSCQSASKNDPWSASNFDPVWRAGF